MSGNNNNSKMKVDYVIKRNGTKQEISFDKILKRVKSYQKI